MIPARRGRSKMNKAPAAIPAKSARTLKALGPMRRLMHKDAIESKPFRTKDINFFGKIRAISFVSLFMRIIIIVFS
jgi:hypothetical protein